MHAPGTNCNCKTQEFEIFSLLVQSPVEVAALCSSGNSPFIFGGGKCFNGSLSYVRINPERPLLGKKQRKQDNGLELSLLLQGGTQPAVGISRKGPTCWSARVRIPQSDGEHAVETQQRAMLGCSCLVTEIAEPKGPQPLNAMTILLFADGLTTKNIQVSPRMTELSLEGYEVRSH